MPAGLGGPILRLLEDAAGLRLLGDGVDLTTFAAVVALVSEASVCFMADLGGGPNFAPGVCPTVLVPGFATTRGAGGMSFLSLEGGFLDSSGFFSTSILRFLVSSSDSCYVHGVKNVQVEY